MEKLCGGGLYSTGLEAQQFQRLPGLCTLAGNMRVTCPPPELLEDDYTAQFMSAYAMKGQIDGRIDKLPFLIAQSYGL